MTNETPTARNILLWQFPTIAICTACLLFLSAAVVAFADTPLVAVGDVGCKTSTAKTNLANIAKKKDATAGPMLGLGDYLYNCSPKDVQKNWDAITQEKHGVYGNHDVEKTSSLAWTAKTFGLGASGMFSWKVNDVAIIGVNVYKDFKSGSAQNDYLKAKTKQFCGRDNATLAPVSWVVYAMHEPIQTPSVGGGHGPAKALRSVIEPLAQECGDNVLILEAHNHITAIGNVQGNNHAICGGGGQGGDKLGSLNGFEWGTVKPGYCQFVFKPDSIDWDFIGLDGKTLTHHTFVK